MCILFCYLCDLQGINTKGSSAWNLKSKGERDRVFKKLPLFYTHKKSSGPMKMCLCLNKWNIHMLIERGGVIKFTKVDVACDSEA